MIKILDSFAIVNTGSNLYEELLNILRGNKNFIFQNIKEIETGHAIYRVCPVFIKTN